MPGRPGPRAPGDSRAGPLKLTSPSHPSLPRSTAACCVPMTSNRNRRIAGPEAMALLLVGHAAGLSAAKPNERLIGVVDEVAVSGLGRIVVTQEPQVVVACEVDLA